MAQLMLEYVLFLILVSAMLGFIAYFSYQDRRRDLDE